MTHAEFFTTVIALSNGNEEMEKIAKSYLKSLANKSAKAKSKQTEKIALDEPIRKAIVAYLTDHKSALASELAQVCEVSTPKIVAVTNKMVEFGNLEVKKVKIPKVGERNSYSLK